MKILITLFVTLVLLITIGLQPDSRGTKGGRFGEPVHMNRLSGTLASLDSGSDGVGGPSFDTGYSSRFD